MGGQVLLRFLLLLVKVVQLLLHPESKDVKNFFLSQLWGHVGVTGTTLGARKQCECELHNFAGGWSDQKGCSPGGDEPLPLWVRKSFENQKMFEKTDWCSSIGPVGAQERVVPHQCNVGGGNRRSKRRPSDKGRQCRSSTWPSNFCRA